VQKQKQATNFANSTFDLILDEPTKTLDQSTLLALPLHLRKIIHQMHAKKRSLCQFDAIYALVYSCALETGFIGDWCSSEMLDAYAVNINYSFDRRLILECATIAPSSSSAQETAHLALKLKLTHVPEIQITVHMLDSGDYCLLTAHLTDNSRMMSTSCLTLPVSRYVISKRLDHANLPSCFRNLRELSIKLKNQLLLPLRNDILCDKQNPSLAGQPDDYILMLLKYLRNSKDVIALSSVCRRFRSLCIPYLQNKSKKD